ncbi:hypothetical protein V1502_19080 [Bacillus sp. SCS-153A]|uniref:hypothetical protein n=1 Tax=Rossellomorea sedimentorum TaxID=3115294 RepID=UPI0039058617
MKVVSKFLCWTFFLIGWLLLYSATPTLIDIQRERNYESYMEESYNIFQPDDLSQLSQKQEYQGVIVHTFIQNAKEEIEVNPWGRSVKRADVFVKINGETVTVIEGTDVHLHKGMAAFRGTVEYFLVEERDTGKEEMVIAIETTTQNPRMVGDKMVGMTFDEDSSYRVYHINEEGGVREDNFSLENKTKLQTQLIRPLTSAWHGYHSDILYMMPNPVLPFQLVGGGLLVIVCGAVILYWLITGRKKNSTTRL